MNDEEKAALELTADLWNAFCSLSPEHPSDKGDIAFHIHAIQNILMARPTWRYMQALEGWHTGGNGIVVPK